MAIIVCPLIHCVINPIPVSWKLFEWGGSLPSGVRGVEVGAVGAWPGRGGTSGAIGRVYRTIWHRWPFLGGPLADENPWRPPFFSPTIMIIIVMIIDIYCRQGNKMPVVAIYIDFPPAALVRRLLSISVPFHC